MDWLSGVIFIVAAVMVGRHFFIISRMESELEKMHALVQNLDENVHVLLQRTAPEDGEEYSLYDEAKAITARQYVRSIEKTSILHESISFVRERKFQNKLAYIFRYDYRTKVRNDSLWFLIAANNESRFDVVETFPRLDEAENYVNS